jgi:hypothetical protein
VDFFPVYAMASIIGAIAVGMLAVMLAASHASPATERRA